MRIPSPSQHYITKLWCEPKSFSQRPIFLATTLDTRSNKNVHINKALHKTLVSHLCVIKASVHVCVRVCACMCMCVCTCERACACVCVQISLLIFETFFLKGSFSDSSFRVCVGIKSARSGILESVPFCLECSFMEF